MSKNSLRFHPFNVCRVRAIYEGKELPATLEESMIGTATPITSNDIKTVDALHWYESLHEVSGFGQSDSMGVSFLDFIHGACIFVIHVSLLFLI